MKNFSAKDLNKYVIYKNQIYEIITFCQDPTVTIRSLKDPADKISFAVGSKIAHELIELKPLVDGE